MMKGYLITFDGIDCSGKTTQAELLHSRLIKEGVDAIITREPGGSKLGNTLRSVVLTQRHLKITPLAELLIFLAARSQHYHEKISPNLMKNKIVICDRFIDTTIAYQGSGRGVDIDLIWDIHNVATSSLVPDLSLFLMIDPLVAMRRLKKKDRIESEGIEFFERIHESFLRLSASEPDRIRLIRCDASIDEIQQTIWKEVNNSSFISSEYGVQNNHTETIPAL